MHNSQSKSTKMRQGGEAIVHEGEHMHPRPSYNHHRLYRSNCARPRRSASARTGNRKIEHSLGKEADLGPSLWPDIAWALL